MKKDSLKQEDLKFLRSRSEAVLLNISNKSSILIWSSFIAFVSIVIWMSLAQIDELVRGIGKVIPSSKVQVIQNLEGGILSKVFVKEGDLVKKGDTLLKIDDTAFLSKYEENQLEIFKIKAMIERLKAESSLQDFDIESINDKKNKKEYKKILIEEKKLYDSNKILLENKLDILKRKYEQKQNELKEKKVRLKFLDEKLAIIKEQYEISSSLIEKKATSKMSFLQLKEKLTDIEQEKNLTELLIPKFESFVKQAQNEIDEAKIKYMQSARKELVEKQLKLKQLEQQNKAKEDVVKRTFVKSPVDGIIKRIYINTIGGVIRPGSDIVEIVPIEDNLIIDTKIQPSDIGFLYPGQRAKVRFSSYDFATYGALDGKVINISADTIIDKMDRKNYYIIQIKTDKNYVKDGKKKLPIMPGMVATVDIITGKKTIMSFILKPILRARQNFLSHK